LFETNSTNQTDARPERSQGILALTRLPHSQADRRVCQNLLQLPTPANYAAREEGDAENADAT